MSTETESKLPTIADDLVVTKYKMAADIVNRKLNLVYLHRFISIDDLIGRPLTRSCRRPQDHYR